MTTTPVLPDLPTPTWMMPESMAGNWYIPGAFTADQMREYALSAIAAAQANAPRTRVLTEHSGCGQGTQVDQFTVRLNPGDKVVLVMGRYSTAIAATKGAEK